MLLEIWNSEILITFQSFCIFKCKILAKNQDNKDMILRQVTILWQLCNIAQWKSIP